ncbi:MAG: UDP-N-acetylglucosamine diphosphorylase/glucosamine-1-phosphate N-acetyltransferase [Bacteroidia bacterium]|jgi:UDP-N-acetylglucosamine diphosphorylase/glucosamine-1-phosphate N-acetyltransferase
MNYILFDDEKVGQLWPLTLTRPSADLRLGILTISEKWQHRLSGSFSFKTTPYLQPKFAENINEDNVLINGRCLPNDKLAELIANLKPFEGIRDADGEVIAFTTIKQQQGGHTHIQNWQETEVNWLEYPEQIFAENAAELELDFDLITANRPSANIPSNVSVTGSGRIFIEDSAIVEACYLNASDGPIYIGNHAEIMQGSMIRGAFSLGDHSIVKMGAKIYGATSVGPHSRVGGEINNCVFHGFSNKGHDGFLGNSVIGEWCNLGADSNNSNLKNNYAEVKLWDYTTKRFRSTGKQFCGLIMGDHSKCGINTMFNTGTVIGVCANIFGSGFPRNFVPSFAWGGAAGFSTYQLNKVFETAEVVFSRRNLAFGQVEKELIQHVFTMQQGFRNWENTNNKV